MIFMVEKNLDTMKGAKDMETLRYELRVTLHGLIFRPCCGLRLKVQ